MVMDRCNTTRRGLLAGLGIAIAGAAAAHGLKAGDLVIDHPYALPSAAGSTSSSVHFRALRNSGGSADTLLAASTDAAAGVLIQRRRGDGVETLSSLPIPPGASLRSRHDGEFALRLLGLKAPLREGDRVSLVLRFAQAGEREVIAWVQTPRSASR
jgi:hypothetical protein